MKRTIVNCLVAAVLMLGFTVQVTQAQESAKPGTPEAVVKAAFDAMNKLDWELYASYMHPEALEAYKAILWPIVQTKFADTAANVANIQLLLGVGRDADGNLPDYPAGDFFSNSLLQITEAVPQLKQQLSRGDTRVIGKVVESEDTVHVVVRVTYKTAMGDSVSEVKVVSLRQTSNGWKLLLSPDLRTLAMGIAQLISQ